jgi:D-alanine-D-alanine ligase
MAKKIRVAVLYGGRSGEHEISLRSAASVIRNLDRERFEVVPIAIDKQGRWLMNDVRLIQEAMDKGKSALPVFKDAPMVVLPPNPEADTAIIPLGTPGKATADQTGAKVARYPIDVVFPVMHGPLCEDGTIQGLLELADVAYVGCGVLASAVGMDKDVAKRLARDAGIRIVPYLSVKKEAWAKDRAGIAAKVASELGYPAFAKPANMGSSVGVHKISDATKLAAALEDAFRYDTKVLIEKAIDAREIEVAVLENADPGAPALVSAPGEIIPTHEFYSYEAKYLDENGAALEAPAKKLTPAQVTEAQRLGRAAFAALECEGMARVDLFLDRKSGEFYLNEINTIPGFTSISMYPRMWEASGIPYAQLLSKLIDLALARQARKRALVREFLPGGED